MDLTKLIEERARLWNQAKAILDLAESEKRNLGAEERETYDRLCAEIDTFGEQIATLERKATAERIEGELRARPERRTAPSSIANRPQRSRPIDALRTWLAMPAGQRPSAEAIQNARDCGLDLSARSIHVRFHPPGESRSMTTGGAGAGGEYDVFGMPGELDRALLFYGNALGLVRKLPTSNGVPLPLPTVNDTANAGAIVAEEAAIAVTPDPTTGSVTLGAFMYTSKAVKVSLQLVQDSIVPLETLIPDLLGERIGRIINTHIIAGVGTTEPNGIFPRATASGVVVSGTLASPTLSGDHFIDTLHSVDKAYRDAPGAGWIMHDTIVARARKLKDTAGQYIWQPSLQAANPDLLCGYPVYTNNAAPTWAANARIAAFGDYKRYTWREVAGINLFRLDELFIMNGQIAFAGLYRADGNLLNTAAVKTLAAPAA